MDSFQKRVYEALRTPENYPDEMRAWVPRYLSQNIAFKLTNFQLPSVEQTFWVGTAGAPAFSGSWVNYGSGNEDAGFYKDPFGRVFLCGLVKLGTAGSTIYSITAGYRPRKREVFAVATDTGYGRVDVDANGNVIHVSGGTGHVQLSGINFRAYT